jgi:hypothetical protein
MFDEEELTDIIPQDYSQDDDELTMNRKDKESKARRMQRVGIIRFCYQQIEK